MSKIFFRRERSGGKRPKAWSLRNSLLIFRVNPRILTTLNRPVPYLMRKVTCRPYVGWISSRFVSFKTQIWKYAFLALKNHTETLARQAIFHGTQSVIRRKVSVYFIHTIHCMAEWNNIILLKSAQPDLQVLSAFFSFNESFSASTFFKIRCIDMKKEKVE